MLRACSRVLKRGAPLAFYVIAVADGLSAEDGERATEAGPTHVAAGSGYEEMMIAAGFDDVELVDVSDQYLVTLSAWIAARDAESAALERLLGVAEFAEGQESRLLEAAAIRDGLLRRYLVSGVSAGLP